MGKNRKSRNVEQVQMQNGPIETDFQNQEIPEDFLTSDDFCIVQKKRGSKKSPDSESSCPRSRSNSGKTISKDDTSKCYMSFWTCKSNVNGNDCSVSVHSDELKCQLNEIHEDNSHSSLDSINSTESDNSAIAEFNSAENYKEEIVPTSGKTAEVYEKLPINNGKPEELFENIFDGKKSLPNQLNLQASDTNKGVGFSKKLNKKKDLRKTPVEEEVERLLKELESDKRKTCVSPSYGNSLICTSASVSDKTSSCPKSNDTTIDENTIKSPVIFNKDIELKSPSEKSDEMCKVCNDFENINDNLNQDVKVELVSVSTDINSKSYLNKRKVKKSKAKQKNIENGVLEVSENIVSNGDQSDFQKEESLKCNSEKRKGNAGDLEKRKKRPSKKQLAMIHEALKKAKEDEERFKNEEETKQKVADEVERNRLEKLRLEQEKKEKKKLKEKQRRDKMKAEGRLLSKSQKQSRARMEATLAALRQQGFDVPQICDKKPKGTCGPRLGNCKNFHRKRVDSCQSTDSAIVMSERQKYESFSSQESKDSLSDFQSGFDSTEDSALIQESDKGNFSCSEESDALDENFLSNKNMVKVQASSLIKTAHSDIKENSVKLRSPVVCVLGHVDTGKTKLLDYIRKTHVQDSEAGGITQQIGATMIPHEALKEKCKMVKDFSLFDIKIPGLLVIDTPGHESFSNLRLRGSSICDIAVLVVDIMHGLEPQTIESINLLKKGKIPFVVALNKIDRIYGWKNSLNSDIETTLMNQLQATQAEFKKRCQEVILQFANQCLNAALYFENKDPRSYVSMVPISAITGDGMGNILGVVAQLTQSLMQKKLIYSEELEATVLEVKAIPGLGTTIDVILVNGRLQEGDTIVLAGQEGPIVTQIRSLLMPQSLKELRVKNPYTEYKSVEGAQGVKITGKDLEKSIAGLPLLIARSHNMVDTLKNDINNLFHDAMSSIRTSERGVYVQASTLGSLEALLNFLSSSGIPYFNVKIGPVVKKDVVKASVMLEHDVMYAAILAFDVKIERDAQELADSLGVQIFHADIIYHLFDMYMKYKEDLLLKRQEDIKRLAVFPCKLKILPEFVFSAKDPIVLGVHIEAGTLKEGTPVCVPSRDILEVGIVFSIEVNHSKVSCAKKGEDVCITINPKPGESPKMYGKHFNHDDLLVSRITRQSIDTCKEHYRSELHSCDWHLMVELKKMLHIM